MIEHIGYTYDISKDFGEIFLSCVLYIDKDININKIEGLVFDSTETLSCRITYSPIDQILITTLPSETESNKAQIQELLDQVIEEAQQLLGQL